MAKILIENGADVNAVSDHGDVPLHYAALCENDCVEVAMRLIEAGANLNIRNTKGAPPLGFTFAYRNSEVAQLLIRNGADTTGISPWWSE